MKAVIVSALALSLLSVAVAVTQTYYSDAACGTQAAGTINPGGLVNPVVAALNACVKYSTVSYVKFTACSSTAAYALFSDAGCATQISPSGTQLPVGLCSPVAGLTGVGSMKVTCSATSATLAIIAVVASALVLCL